MTRFIITLYDLIVRWSYFNSWRIKRARALAIRTMPGMSSLISESLWFLSARQTEIETEIEIETLWLMELEFCRINLWRKWLIIVTKEEPQADRLWIGLNSSLAGKGSHLLRLTVEKVKLGNAPKNSVYTGVYSYLRTVSELIGFRSRSGRA